jgi:prolipoprotein diacylglyceryltransferase
VREKNPDPKVVQLDNLERRVFWYSLIVMLGLAAAALGASLLISVTNKSLDQVDELSDRVDRLAVAPSPSEQPKT